MSEYINTFVALLQTMPMANALCILCIAHALDVMTTVDVLDAGGYELNPLARWSMAITQRMWGSYVIGLIFIKGLSTALLLWLCSNVLPILLVACITLCVGVHNRYVFKKLDAQKLLRSGK